MERTKSLFLPGFNSNAILSAYADDVIGFFKKTKQM